MAVYTVGRGKPAWLGNLTLSWLRNGLGLRCATGVTGLWGWVLLGRARGGALVRSRRIISGVWFGRFWGPGRCAGTLGGRVGLLCLVRGLLACCLLICSFCLWILENLPLDYYDCPHYILNIGFCLFAY